MSTSPHNRKHLALWLAAIFGAFHLIFMGLSILEVDWRGGDSGGDIGLVFFDFPLFALCQYHPAVCKWLLPNSLSLLVAGTLMYALAGLIIGAVIDWVRALIARRRGEH